MISSNIKNRLIIFIFLALVITFDPARSHAVIFGSLGGSLCAVYNCIMNNGLIAIIATLAIFFLGLNSFFGKANWGQILSVVLGIVIMSGAMAIAVTFTGNTGTACANSTLSGATC